jgi:hypothetical protein
VGGIDDMPGVPNWLPQAEFDLIHSDSRKAGLAWLDHGSGTRRPVRKRCLR